MANVQSGNTFYIDTAYSSSKDDWAQSNLQVTAIFVSATAANGQLVLSDPKTGAKKLDLRVATSGDTLPVIFRDTPLVFPNGIRALTLTNAVATVVASTPGAGG